MNKRRCDEELKRNGKKDEKQFRNFFDDTKIKRKRKEKNKKLNFRFILLLNF